MDGLAYKRCDHYDHRTLSSVTIKGLDCASNTLGYIARDRFWKRASVYVESVLKDTPLAFQYGNSCFSDLVDRLSRLELPRLQELVSVGSGVALLECYIAYKVFNTSTFHATDIAPPHGHVKRLSCLEAIHKYKGAQGLMFMYPCFLASGYEDVICNFKGTYIILIGEISHTGHTNPGNLLEQILIEFEPLVHVDMVRIRTSFGCHESLVLYKRKQTHSRPRVPCTRGNLCQTEWTPRGTANAQSCDKAKGLGLTLCAVHHGTMCHRANQQVCPGRTKMKKRKTKKRKKRDTKSERRRSRRKRKRKMEKCNRERNNKHRVRFRDPEYEIDPIPVCMSADSVHARSRYWETIALDTFRFRVRIEKVNVSISRCFEQTHRDKIMSYIQAYTEPRLEMAL